VGESEEGEFPIIKVIARRAVRPRAE